MSYHLVALTQILNLIVYHLFEFGLLRTKFFIFHLFPDPTMVTIGKHVDKEKQKLDCTLSLRPLRRENRHGQPTGQCPVSIQ